MINLGITDYFRKLEKYRFFIETLVKTEFKRRYTQSLLGLMWLIFEPLILVLSLSFIFTMVDRQGPFGSPFPAFFYTGVFLWNIFGSSLSSGPGAFIKDKAILSKVNYPREISAFRETCVYFFEFCFSLIPLLGILLFYRITPNANWLFLPVLVVITLLLAYFVTIFLGSMNVYVRDVGILSRSIKTVWFWFTPIIFEFPEGTAAEYLYYINPMAGIIKNVRNIMLFDQPIVFEYLYCSLVWLVGLSFFGMRMFRRLERRFLDVL